MFKKQSMRSGKEAPPKNHKAGRKIIFAIGTILMLLAVLSYALNVQGIFQERWDPLELAQASIDNTFNSNTYHFKARSTLFIEGEERVFSILEGDKAGENRHIEGSVLGTPVNIYHVEDQFYMQDSLTAQWKTVTNTDLKAASILIAELDPEKDFHFLSLGNCEDLGKSEIEGIKTRHIKAHPVLEDKWIERYFQDITYDLHIATRGEPKLIYVEVSGVSKENTEAKLVIQNYFSNYKKDIQILAPNIQ